MIPTVDNVRSAPLVHRFGDTFNLPGLTNFLGCVQADLDISGIRSLNFPPFATSDAVTGCLFVNGRFFKATAAPITFTWMPDRIERSAEWDGLVFSSVTVMAVGGMGALVRLQVQNRSGVSRAVRLKFGLQGGVTQARRAWTEPPPPTEPDNEVLVRPDERAVVFRARASRAVSYQLTFPGCSELSPRSMEMTLGLDAGATATVAFVHTLGETEEDARDLAQALGRDAQKTIRRSTEEWNAELRAVFTPGNERYSGHLPSLETDDADLQAVYLNGILGVVYFKRDSPFSVLGRAYDTLMPKWWQTVTFLWDYSLSSVVHALLDPAVMKNYLEHWMRTDIHTCFGTEWLTGGKVGPWYSVNDFAMSLLARDYLRWSGDLKWLASAVGHGAGGETGAGTGASRVIDYVMKYARNWREFRQPSGLADYGGILNLLECVSTYVHQVASLNAGNVFNLRFAADVLELQGRGDEARALREEAAVLVRSILPLYSEGRGYWRARFPDGSLVDVRHCYDFFTVINTIGDDLSTQVRNEMVEFFKREFHSPTWMHALSCDDDDAMFSVRPDHQWNGAYPAWPPQALLALFRAGDHDFAVRWLKGLARSANQGPFGQAHFVDPIVPPDAGGARKAPIEFPYITDWTVSSGGSWVSAIIEGLFGVEAGLTGGLRATPRFGTSGIQAELRNLAYQGKNHTITPAGVQPAR